MCVRVCVHSWGLVLDCLSPSDPVQPVLVGNPLAQEPLQWSSLSQDITHSRYGSFLSLTLTERTRYTWLTHLSAVWCCRCPLLRAVWSCIWGPPPVVPSPTPSNGLSCRSTRPSSSVRHLTTAPGAICPTAHPPPTPSQLWRVLRMVWRWATHCEHR